MTSSLSAARRIVVKIGSSLIVRDGALRNSWATSLAGDIAGLRQDGKQVLLVSSGAVALGRHLLGKDRLRRLEDKQAAAALGQPFLMQAWSKAFSGHGFAIAQALLTLDDTERRRRWLNARATLEALLEAGALPVINENDTVATDEIRYGDNDRLAARVAQMVSADMLVLLSDVDGLYTADPRIDPEAELVPHIDDITAAHEAMAGHAHAGSGGMATKLTAARIAHGAGCTTVIASGEAPNPLAGLLAGGRATRIVPAVSPDTARRNWLRGHLTPEGTIFIDDGAATALSEGASLLAVGIVRVEGVFARGAAVAVETERGVQLAKGVTAYAAEDIARIAGLQSRDVESALGHTGRPCVIHRNDLVLDQNNKRPIALGPDPRNT